METTSTAVTSIRRRNDVEKSTWKTHRYFVDFESWIYVEISTSNRYHNFHVDSPFKIDEILMKFPRGISTSNRWWIDEDVSIGLLMEACALNNLWCYYTENDVATKVRGRRYDYSRKDRSSRSQMFFKIGALKNLRNFTKKHVLESLKLQA